MSRFNTLKLLSVLILILAFSCQNSVADENRLVPGQLVLKLSSQANINSFLEQLNGTLLNEITEERVFLLQLPDSSSIADVVQGLNNNPDVVYAQGNVIVELPEVHQISQGFPDQNAATFIFGESPPDYYEQTYVYNTGIADAQETATGSGIKVAVIDNGIDFDHPLISASEILFAHDFLGEDSDPTEEPGRLYGHGTFVTSLVLLTAPEARIMPLRAFDGEGYGDQFAVANAIFWAIRHKADVINMSFGSVTTEPVLVGAITAAYESGITLIASAGNNGEQLALCPANMDQVIAVNSFDTLEVMADFSNYGDYLDLCAPGVNIYGGLAGEYDWGIWSGTSFSAPLVTGTAALMLEVFDDKSPANIAERLRQSARTNMLWGQVTAPDLRYGWGALDAFAAVTGQIVGDVDASGTLNQNDLDVLVGYINGWPSGPNFSRPRADVNRDGRVNMADVTALKILIQANEE